jgi:hypothetical protein
MQEQHASDEPDFYRDGASFEDGIQADIEGA